MAELTTIARPYAEAAFRIAQESQAYARWSDTLSFASAVVADPRVAGALDNPQLTTADKEALLLSICGDRVDAIGRNFVRVLVDAKRVSLLPQIATLYEGLRNEAEGRALARIETAFPLSAAELAGITASLEKHFGKKIDASVEVDPALIGGARITVGDTVIDGTVQAKLQAMATQLRA
jgi:F-type H+-transporting ATPase subunit delta